MKSMLQKLKKAIERATEGQEPTCDITLADFPDHVLKSLEIILADNDEERAARRLALLKAEVDGARALLKQTAGAAEDLEPVRVQVVVFEEPGLTAKPTVEHELRVAGAKRKGAAGREETLQKAVESLQREVTELKRALGGLASDDTAPASAEARKDGATSQGSPDTQPADVHMTERTSATKQEGGASESKAATRENAREVSWPLDMNTTMPSAQPVTKADTELDWGPDPEFGPRAA